LSFISTRKDLINMKVANEAVDMNVGDLIQWIPDAAWPEFHQKTKGRDESTRDPLNSLK
jgi:hypothetical protein